jgi:protein-L-isoaspartate(D-aspartate) O-methyltransferase
MLRPRRVQRQKAFVRTLWMSVLCLFFVGMLSSCRGKEAATTGTTNMEKAESQFKQARLEMVERQIAGRDVRDPRVLDAMRKVERDKFVPPSQVPYAYYDQPLPIGEGQTISQPYIVALMTELLEPKPTDVVLEVGTGSGYQAAVLAELVKEVYSIEIITALAESAKERLQKLGYKNVVVKAGDGYQGWKEHAPFDGIIVTAAPDHVPQPLVDQLKEGGKLVIPVGDIYQELVVITKTKTGTQKRSVIPVRFVPMTGESEKHHK